MQIRIVMMRNKGERKEKGVVWGRVGCRRQKTARTRSVICRLSWFLNAVFWSVSTRYPIFGISLGCFIALMVQSLIKEKTPTSPPGYSIYGQMRIDVFLIYMQHPFSSNINTHSRCSVTSTDTLECYSLAVKWGLFFLCVPVPLQGFYAMNRKNSPWKSD